MNMDSISVGNAAITAFLGYVVVFIGLILLILILKFASLFFTEKKPQAKPETAAAPVEVKKAEAAGTAGELKLYDTDPKDAAMIMAIVADTLGKPLNQLRFISIKEVKD